MSTFTELQFDRTPNHRECATILASLRGWQATLKKFGITDEMSASDIAAKLAVQLPHYDHFTDSQPLTLGQIDALCMRINLGPKKTPRIVSINLEPAVPLETDDTSLLDQVENLLVNHFGEDERDDIGADECFELLRHISDDLLDSRTPESKQQRETVKKALLRAYEWLCTGEAQASPYHRETYYLVTEALKTFGLIYDPNARSEANATADIPKQCECDNTHAQKKTVCRFCWDTKVKPYIEGGSNKCLSCGSTSIEGTSAKVDSHSAWQPIACNDCGAEWNDVYKLVSVGEIVIPDNQTK